MQKAEPNEIEKFINELNSRDMAFTTLPNQQKPLLYTSRDEQGEANGAWIGIDFTSPGKPPISYTLQLPCNAATCESFHSVRAKAA
jgi:hypothetical protein